jgi:signal transduction histidine kinase
VNGATKLAVSAIDTVTASEGDNTEGETAADVTGTRLLRELCHDLIAPAASIKLLAHAACAESDPDPAVRGRLQLIANEAAMIAEICGQVLDRPRRIDPVRLDALTAEAVARAQLRYRGVVERVINPVTVLVHPAVVVRILNNLLSNACRAAGPHGRVRVQVALDSAHARLSVADSGPGLVGPRVGRTALGLEIVGSLVLGCGGTVQMEVSDLGGLCVTVSLSCLPQPEPPPEPPRGRGPVLVGRPGPGREDGSVPG